MAAMAPQAQYPNLASPTPQHAQCAPPSPAPSMRSVRIKSPAPSGRSVQRSSGSSSSLAPSPLPRSPGSLRSCPPGASCCPPSPSLSALSARTSPLPRTPGTPGSPGAQYELLERKSAEVTRSLLEAIDDLDEKDSVIAELHHAIGDLTQKLVDLRRDNVQIVKAAAPLTGAPCGAGERERIRELEVENEVLRRRIAQVSVVRASI